ncbi:MAG: sulfide/dihydroorotate dehydrogenase-like FAD/NAD-binding protein [Actinomycetes bacterium]|jgi:ferredoxin--NADP+ reductase|nr:sulfide/dihydroorotate dehydrogenase-like FAD/NAD-binding protein [Actinomycetes bacterium]
MNNSNNNNNPNRYTILEKTRLSPSVVRMRVYAPRVAAKAAAGQFFLLRAHARGERVPFTFSDWSADAGWIQFVFLVVGKTTAYLADLEVGQAVCNVAGPLGRPTRIAGTGPVIVVGGGVGVAVAYPVARMLAAAGRAVYVISGARTAELLILQDELAALDLAAAPFVTTDDGSAGDRGLVTAPLAQLCAQLSDARAFVVGPAVMMRFAAQTALDAGVPVTASLNPLMVDGTGMCGACRVSIDGATHFACVEGPDFNAARVDWDELAQRQRTYAAAEQLAYQGYRAGDAQRMHDDCSCWERGPGAGTDAVPDAVARTAGGER